MRDKETKERDELAEKEGITPAAAAALLAAKAPKPTTKDPNHKDAT